MAEGTAQEPNKDERGSQGQVDPADLALLDDSLEDEDKSDDELWDEIEAEEAASSGDATPDSDTDADLAADAPGDAEDAAAAEAEVDAAGDEEGDDKPKPAEAKKTDNASDDDVWANATDAQKAELQALRDNLKKARSDESAHLGRVRSLQRRLNELETQGPTGKDASKDASKTGSVDLETEEGWKAFKAEYPELADPVGKVLKTAFERIDRLEGKQQQADEDDHVGSVEAETALLNDEHPDWQEIVGTDDFGKWLLEQPRHMQEAAVRNAEEIVDASEAADVVGRFKAFRSAQAPKDESHDEPDPGRGSENGTALSDRRRRQLDASGSTRTKGQAPAMGIPEDGDEQALWDAWDAKERREAARA